MSDSEKTVKGISLWVDAWIRLKNNKMALVSLIFISIIVFLSFFIPIVGELLAPTDALERSTSHWYKDPNYQNLDRTFDGPSGDHWLGTDHSGRDLLARLLSGGQISLLVGIVATALSLVMGVAYGAIAGYSRRKVDTIMMRIVDVLYGLPFLVLVILFSLLISEYMEQVATFLMEEWKWDTTFVKRYTNLVPLFVGISALGWLTMARMARAQVQNIKQLEYIEAARSLGLSHFKILTKHIIPNMLGPIVVYTTLTVPGFILTEATLSYLGLGVDAPNSSWGILLEEGSNFMETAPRLLIVPSIVFTLTLLALNFLGDGLRDALDPKASKD